MKENLESLYEKAVMIAQEAHKGQMDKGGNPYIEHPLYVASQVETLELTDLPECPAKTTRLRITLKPLSDQEIQVSIKDLGFGEIRKSSDKVFLYTLKM